ncbi:MAG: VWA domain-containing protein [Clostridia bacterium]|nr:VWA domain-containing protein [Clostridia bacterium]
MALKMTYNVDMCFCIDATGSMGPVISTVKENALSFYKDVTQEMARKQKTLDSMRVRVIVFRDYKADDEPMMVTRFFNLPEQSSQFETCIHSIEAMGGGDEPEDGLEALAYAIRSDWTKEGTKRRNIIVVWTDASTHEIGFGRSSTKYPNGMPADFNELTRWWGDSQMEPYIKNAAKRLVLFAPNAPYWQQITSTWNNVIHYPSTAGKGLQEYTYKEIIDAICNSI